MSEYFLNTENINEWVSGLRAGDRVYLSGKIYTARDAAHKKISALISDGEELPFDLNGSVVYFAGPTPAKGTLAVGSIGPTTSSRMDCYSPLMLENGQKAMIGKGNRSPQVIESIKDNSAVYFAAVGGAGALYSECVKSCRVIAFPELGCESVKELNVVNFPLLVAIDSKGNSLYS